jgi:ABC-type glycerol-3-phosphate transport system substrate-binding protein
MKQIKILLLAVVASLVFAGCGNNSKTPSDIALKVMDAAKDLDFKTIKQYLTNNPVESLEEFEKSIKENTEETNDIKERMKGAKWKIVSENIAEDGNSATVKMEIIFVNGETKSHEVDLVKVDGEWKVDNNPFD